MTADRVHGSSIVFCNVFVLSLSKEETAQLGAGSARARRLVSHVGSDCPSVAKRVSAARAWQLVNVTLNRGCTFRVEPLR